MTDSQNNPTGKQTGPTNVQEETHFEDEINLIDYFKVIWKRKSLILLGSVLPALLVGLILFFSPRSYKVTYVYDVKDRGIHGVKDQSIHNIGNWNLSQNNYKIFLERFYSTENTNKIKAKLQEYKPEAVNFEVWPSYIDLSKTTVKDLTQVEQIRQSKAQLLNMTLVTRPKNNIFKISLAIRDNLENVIPVYATAEHLNTAIRELRDRLADIEDNRFKLELDLETYKVILDKLKNIETQTPDGSASNIVLQLDINGKTEYLPVGYQIQAAESKITHVGRQIAINEEKHSYYRDLLGLNEKLLAELKSNIGNYYTIQQFHSFLTGLVDSSKDKKLRDYLNSYIRRIKNRMSVNTPVMEKPKVYPIPSGAVKKTAIVFAISLMISIFAAFLLESIQKSKA